MKGNMLLGRSQGRIGDVVAKIVHGEQIYSKYQPNVFNPNTAKQGAVRSIFSAAASFAKHSLIDGFVSNTYAVLKGSARSIYLNVVTMMIYVQKMKGGAAGISEFIRLPLLLKTINENTFSNQYKEVADGIAPYINGALPTGSKIYFGSISKLSSLNGKVFGYFTGGGLPLGMASSIASPFLVEEVVSSPFAARVQGFQNSSDDCGGWPYMYSMSVAPVSKAIFSEKPLPIVVDDESVSLVHLIFTNDKAEVFGYDIADNILPA